MASDILIIDGDTVQFNPLQGMAIVVVRPVKIKASGKTKIKGKKICIQGDETKVEVANCMYSTPSFPVPGKGVLKIASLASNQLTKKSKSANKPMLLKGAVFNSKFEVQSPAKLITPTGEVPDPMPFYMGVGKFTPNNNSIKAT